MTKLEQVCESKSSHYRSNNLELAARQALEAMEEGLIDDKWYAAKDAMREALAEQAERVTEGNGSEVSLETEAQEPVVWVDLTGAEIGEVWAKHPRDFDKCVAIIEKFKEKNTTLVRTKKKPVAWMCSDSKLLGIGYSRFSECCAGIWNIPVYAAPVQQVDLSDDEIHELVLTWEAHALVRAAIAAYKEKNK